MKVKELIALLQSADGEREIYASSDAEQNSISPVLEVTDTQYGDNQTALVIVPSDGGYLEIDL